jgi:hypothetical protein
LLSPTPRARESIIGKCAVLYRSDKNSVSTNLAEPAAVGRSRFTNRLARVRQHAIARLSALAIITLILLPFTAPFPTYELDPAHGHPYDALPKEYKNKLDSDDGLILPAICCASIPALSQVAVRPGLRLTAIVEPPPQHTVLRL